MSNALARSWLATILLFSSFSLLSANMPTDVTILTQKDFTARPLFSVADALRGSISIKIEQDGSRGTRALAKMRGLSSSNNVLVLLDGRPLTHEYDGEVDLTQFPLGMVERIEITRGGASSIYSSEAVAGTINIITLRPVQKGLLSDLGTGVGRDGEKNTIMKFSLRSNWGDMTYAPSLEASGGYSNNEDFETTNHFGNFTRSFNGKGYWGAEYYYHDSRVGLSHGTPVPFEQWDGHLEQEPSTPSEQRTQESQHAKVFLATPLLAGGTTYATFTESWRDLKDRVTRSGIAYVDEDMTTSTFDLSWHRSIFDFGWRSQEFKREAYLEAKRTVTQEGFFAAAKWQTKKWTLAPGVRYDDHSVSGGFLAPRLAVIFSPVGTFSLSATAQRAHRTPEFNELYESSATIANPDLNDEKSTNADAGFLWSPSKVFDFRATGFLVNKKDLITPDANSVWTNAGEEKARGMEIESSARFAVNTEHMSEFTARYTLQNSERKLPGYAGFVDAAMSPHNLLTAIWDFHFPPKMKLTNEITYQSEQFELDNKQGVRVPGFYTWNARWSLRILTADMFFAAHNITRRRYAETTARAPVSGGGYTTVLSPQPERTFWIGASIRFIN